MRRSLPMIDLGRLVDDKKVALLLYIPAGLSFLLNMVLIKEQTITESFLEIVLLIVALIVVAKIPARSVQISATELIGIISFLFLFRIQYSLADNIRNVFYWPLLIFLYFAFKHSFLRLHFSFQAILISFISILILFFYVVGAIWHCYLNRQPLESLYSPNSSIFAILIASQLSLTIPLLLHLKKKLIPGKAINYAIITILTGALILLVVTRGRSGWIGFTMAMIYLFYHGKNPLNKIAWLALSGCAFLSIYALSLYKPQSSNGRLLIYKISATILKDNWLWGIGSGQFKVRYNEYQAAYFATHNIDNNEALLADNTYYAFNDYLQFVMETGLVGLLLLAIFLVSFCKRLRKIKLSADNKPLYTAAMASLICIATGALFSYPLQIFPIALQAILCLSIIATMPSSKSAILLTRNAGIFLKTGMLAISLVLIVHCYFYVNFLAKSEQAIASKKAGFSQQSLASYKTLSASYIKDGQVLYRYAKQLYLTNQLEEARTFLREAKKYHCSNEVYKLSAAIENDLQNFGQAEKDYKTAIYMVPNRMMSRSDLLNFYLERRDTVHATYWANSILHMPVKIPSPITATLQERTKKMLLELNTK